jgi:hypothetical protein
MISIDPAFLRALRITSAIAVFSSSGLLKKGSCRLLKKLQVRATVLNH